ncbi:protein of unknown function [Methanoculleus bourgensis]|uniref:Uncharacterized protein n=1 Tax=Methanoculleus bourgensis TaxID=83986 RepID=A0A0X3BKD7_9EURY|nr:protein of unknown function [Methanoculleus bourgensis]
MDVSMSSVKTLPVTIIAGTKEKTLLNEGKTQKRPGNATIASIARSSLWKRKALSSSGGTFQRLRSLQFVSTLLKRMAFGVLNGLPATTGIPSGTS